MELVLDDRSGSGRRDPYAVSILVFVELVLDVYGGICTADAVGWFQSLFSWNLFLMLNLSVVNQWNRGVSILVFVELVLDVRLKSQ